MSVVTSSPSEQPPLAGLVDASLLVGSIMSNTTDAILAVSFQGIILSWNRGAEMLFGYSETEVLGRHINLFLDHISSREAVRAFAKLRSGGPLSTYESARQTRRGKHLEVQVSLSLLKDREGKDTGVLAITRDISRQREADRALAIRLKQQSAVAWFGQRVLSGVDLEILLHEAVILVRETLGTEFVKILEFRPGAESMFFRAGVGWGDGVVGAPYSASGLDSQAGFTLRSREPVIVGDLTCEERFHAAPLLLRHGIVSGISTCIEGETGGDPYGVLGAHTATSRVFTQEDVDFLQSVATLLSTAILQRRALADRQARLRAEEGLRASESASQQRLVLLEAANRVALDILSSRMGVEALRHIAEAARFLANAQYAALGVAKIDGPGLSEFITSGLTPEQEAAIGDLPRGKGILGLLLEHDQPLRVDKLGDHPASVGFPPNHPPMDSFLGVPIRRGDTTVGSLYLTNKLNGESFTETDQAAVGALGSYAAVAIHNLRMLSHQRDLTRSLLTAQEEERRIVAHDLHDGLTQYVMAAQAHLEAFKRAHAAGKDDRATVQLDKSMGYLREAVVESRRMINNLRLLVLDDLGLVGALEQLLQEEITRTGWEAAHLEHNIGEDRFDVTLETAVYRIAQEALTNARKYAESPRVSLHLTRQTRNHETRLVLAVRDWGKGFDFKAGLEAPNHFGLKGMLERVGLHNGTFEMLTAPGTGAELRATFPL